MTSVRTLATSAKLLRAESDRRIAALHNAEAAAKVADAPFDSHINAITKARCARCGHLDVLHTTARGPPAISHCFLNLKTGMCPCPAFVSEPCHPLPMPCVTCGRPTIHRNYLNAFDDQGMPQCNPCYDGSPE